MATEGRTRILEAARTLFLEGGAPAVTMRSVADRVGVTATALYRHFESKDAMLEAVVASGFETFGTYLYRALDAPTAEARLRRSGEEYMRFALEQPQMYRTIFMTPRPQNVEGGPHGAATFRFLVDRVRDCMAEGVLGPGDSEGVAHTIWAHVHGLVSLQIVCAIRQTDVQFREAYAASLHRIFTGLLTRVNAAEVA